MQWDRGHRAPDEPQRTRAPELAAIRSGGDEPAAGCPGSRLPDAPPVETPEGIGATVKAEGSAQSPPKRFSSDRKMLTIETKIPVASQTASRSVPCLRR